MGRFKEADIIQRREGLCDMHVKHLCEVNDKLDRLTGRILDLRCKLAQAEDERETLREYQVHLKRI